jgi:hypothetical protein
MRANKYRIVKKINGHGVVKFFVELRVMFFFWSELRRWRYGMPTGETESFETQEGAKLFIKERMDEEADETWVRAK